MIESSIWHNRKHNKKKKIKSVISWIVFAYLAAVVIPIASIVILFGEEKSMPNKIIDKFSTIIDVIYFGLTSLVLFLIWEKKIWCKNQFYKTRPFILGITINLAMIIMLIFWFFIAQKITFHKIAILDTSDMLTILLVDPIISFWIMPIIIILLKYIFHKNNKLFLIIVILLSSFLVGWWIALCGVFSDGFTNEKSIIQQIPSIFWWTIAFVPVINLTSFSVNFFATSYGIIAITTNILVILAGFIFIGANNSNFVLILKSENKK